MQPPGYSNTFSFQSIHRTSVNLGMITIYLAVGLDRSSYWPLFQHWQQCWQNLCRISKNGTQSIKALHRIFRIFADFCRL